MKTLVLVVPLLVFSLTIQAQKPINPDLQTMVDAERAFIAMARDQNRRDAFLHFLTDDAITKGPDGPAKGKDRLKSQPVQNDLLHWDIVYSDIAASGDFGFNTGPWEYRARRTDPAPAAYGTFNSIWIKQKDGSWKNALDIGISHGAPKAKVIWSTSKRPLKKVSLKFSNFDGKKGLFAAEYEFQKECVSNRKVAYRKYLSSEARINYTGSLPFTYNAARQKFVDNFSTPANLRLVDGAVAASNDLGYVYGTADVPVTTAGKTEIKKAVYVRVWKKEDGKNWRIVLDVLTF